jgi:hypothetical protein
MAFVEDGRIQRNWPFGRAAIRPRESCDLEYDLRLIFINLESDLQLPDAPRNLYVEFRVVNGSIILHSRLQLTRCAAQDRGWMISSVH